MNVQFFLYIILNFYFANSFRDSSTVYDIYWTTLERNDNSFLGKVYKDHNKISDMRKLRWASICRHLTKKLRSNEGYVDIYVNYLATSLYSGKWCIKISVWVPKISANVEQDACVCFTRSSIIALDIPREYINYYRKIMIYPLNKEELMVFSYNEERESYSLLEIYDQIEWTRYCALKFNTGTTVMPYSYGDISNLQIILNPIFSQLTSYSEKNSNVVNLSAIDNLLNICQIVYRRARYIKEIEFSAMLKIPTNQERLTVILTTGNDQFRLTYITAYTCTGHIPKTSKIITKFKIAAGLNEHSVIVLKEIDCPSESYSLSEFPTNGEKCYEIIELIEYLSFQYIYVFLPNY